MREVTTSSVSAGSFRFEVATPADDAELRAFGRNASMPGAIRFSFNREPDYFGALRVEGRQSEVLICREVKTRRVVGTGHRSVKPVFVNGESRPVGYLSGLRVAPSARNARILARGYAALRERHADGAARFYLTTIMEDNAPAQAALLSGRCGLPRYHDFGRYCCMAISVQTRSSGAGQNGIRVRRACAADGPAIVSHLQHEGRTRQFFPEYRVEDFGADGGLLSQLNWEDIFLAYRGNELVGMVAAWDQRTFRQWQVTGYAPWLRLLRRPFNLLAKLKGMPPLPKPGAPLDYLILSLVCIRDSDRAVFAALLQVVTRVERGRCSILMAGLHELDPLLPELLARPHYPLPSRLYVVAWDDGEEAVKTLDRGLVPYLELGSL